MKKIKYILIFIFGILLIPQTSFAQVNFDKRPDDDLGNVEDEYQEHFFEALKQKGIENYERAIEALQKCLNLDSTKPVIFYELGKNYNSINNFGSAEENLKTAISMQPDNEWFLDELYDVYSKQNDIDKAIKTVKQLVKYHPDYKMDLATLYIKKEKYKEALRILDELDTNFGANEVRDDMRNKIYNVTGNADDRIENIEERIANNPNNEDNHIQLIYRYSQSGKPKKAFEAAKNLLKIKPDSKLVHLALYKFYLDDGDPESAIASMKLVLNTPEINPEVKSKVLKDFVAFVSKNPQYEKDLVAATAAVDDNKDVKTLADLGQYYLKSGDKEKALQNFNEALKQEPTDFKLLKDVLLLQIDLKRYKEAVTQSEDALELYPAQPILYLVNGVANNNIGKPKKAIESLETGLDFLIENPKMEADFYTQLSIAYKLDNNITKSETFTKKAQALRAQQ
ncbi:tetratricopeptide repeat protein [Winogradskyella immobilis]|uniref:Tetratricopeptide repeat protein n=1 Tax=Winogradskyella immobilis TaxID=2816852 RepID=A0ABS8ERF8_9FLAO|nr:tetratricopeptide repeat protein [Winogradskyella immobilis]MCC1485597.1 tetratricopeptide repeat protein [Winogradskyella immobilis]MCG0017689.1 tetratricopeptide repeat protein [Winogradskyella immobilis]